MAERWAGALLLTVTLLAGIAAWGFRVNFIADPVGPRAFPLVALALMAVGAGWMVWRPEGRGMAEAEPEAGEPSLPRTPILRVLPALLAMALVPVLLPTLGFVVSVGGVMWVLALLMGGRMGPAALAALALAGGLFLLFVYGLGVPLPVGELFLLDGSAGVLDGAAGVPLDGPTG